MQCIQITLCLSLATGLICAQNGTALSPLQPGEIRGSVIEPGTNHGIAEVEIAVRFKTPGSVYSPLTLKEVAKITTDDQGNFHFQPQEFGEYILQARKDGYSAMSGNPIRGGLSTQIIVTLDPDHPGRQVNFSLGREGELSGRLVDDETTQPLADFRLDVMQFVYLNGLPRWLPSGGRAVTDGDGRFAVKGLKSGRYVVMIMPRVPSGKDQLMPQVSEVDLTTLDADYPLSYWPGGGDLDSAQPVSIVSGGSADAGTIRLRKSPFYRVHVSIADANCTPGETVQILLNSQFSQMIPVGDGACGHDFLLRNYQPGSYTLILLQGRGPNRTRAIVKFDVTDKNLDLPAMLGRGIDISGRFVAAEGAGQIPLAKLQFRPSSLESTVFADELQPVSADAQGKFQMVNRIPLGKIRIDPIPASGSNYYIKEVRYNGTAAPNNLVTLNPYSGAQSLDIVVDDQPASISGMVHDGDREVDQPFVVLTPWPLPAEMTFTPPKTATGDVDGNFQFAGLAPGEYRVVAVRLADRDKLDEPGVLQRLAASSDKLDVGRGASQSVSLKLLDPSR